MAYQLSGVTIRTNNTAEGMKKIGEVWEDVTSGRLPILFDSSHNFLNGISPVSVYSSYAGDETGDYDLSIVGVTAEFFLHIEQEVQNGHFKKYDASDECGDLTVCTRKAWEQVWEEQRSGKIRRAFTTDYESSVPPEYTKDGKAHCYLYIAVEK